MVPICATYLFSDRENSRQWRHRKGERDDARVYDAQVGRAMHFEVGRDDTWDEIHEATHVGGMYEGSSTYRVNTLAQARPFL